MNPHENAVTIRGDMKARKGTNLPESARSKTSSMKSGAVAAERPKKLSLHEQMLRDAQAASRPRIADSECESSISSSLRDGDISSSADASIFHKMSTIVRKKPEDNMHEVEPLQLESLSSNRVVELD